MQIDAKEIEFINTKVDAEYPATINIKAELNILFIIANINK